MKKQFLYSFIASVAMYVYSHTYSTAGAPFTTLFAPGIFASKLQASKYCPLLRLANSNMLSLHGNTIFDGTTCVACNFSEIYPTNMPLPDKENYARALISALIKKIVIYKDYRYFLDAIEQKPDATGQSYTQRAGSINAFGHQIAISRLNFGQQADIEILSAAYDQAINTTSLPEPVVLFGFSRGAATAYNFIATKYSKKSVKRIKAIVLEACFSSIEQIERLAQTPLFNLIFPAYQRKGICPARKNILEAFVAVCNEYAIPVLMIHSKKDERVPYRQAFLLYQKLKEAGLADITFVTLKQSSHAGYLFEHTPDRLHYHQAVHSFLKKNGLAHNLCYIPTSFQQQ